jgi:hypothetical protein
MNLVDSVLQGATNPISPKQLVGFFARLIHNGTVWKLGGCYGRIAAAFIRLGYITPDGVVTPKARSRQ